MDKNMNDDIIGEILVRLPGKSAARFKTLSKKWHDFVSLNKPIPSLIGFFCTKDTNFSSRNVPNRPQFVPTSTEGGRILNPLEERLQLLPPDESLTFLGQESPHILGSSNGLLLCKIEELYPENYFVCNPMTEQWVKLPPPKTKNSFYVYHGFISSERSASTSYNYKAVRVIHGYDDLKTLTIEIFSGSDDPLTEWKVFNLSAHCRINLAFEYCVLITESGVIYVVATTYSWSTPINHYGLLFFDQREQEKCLKFLEFPKAYYDHCVGVSDGLIRYVDYSSGQLTIWSLDDFTREWTPTHKVSLDRGLIHNHNKDFRNILAIHPLKPNIVFLGDNTKKLVFYMQNSKLEFLCHSPQLGEWKLIHKIFPYTYPLASCRLFHES